MRTWSASWVCVLALAGMAPAGDLAKRFEAIAEEHQSKEDELQARFAKAPTPAEKRRVEAELEKLEVATADRFFALAEKHPEDADAYPALQYLVVSESVHAAKALDLLARHQVESRRVGGLCLALAQGDEVSDKAETLIRAVADKNPHDEAKGPATYALARLLKTRADAKDVAPAERERLRTEAGKAAETAVEKFAKVKVVGEGDRSRTVGDMARPLLFEIRNLGIGATVPDVVGEDTDGKALKLSDYRGKVVLLDFWASWCGACMKMVPHERALVRRMEGRPFALVGVNGDEDAEDAKEATRKAGITWRSLKNRRGNGLPDLAEQWNLEGWPTLYLIDRQGVIRHKWTGSPGDAALDAAVERLVKEAEQGGGR